MTIAQRRSNHEKALQRSLRIAKITFPNQDDGWVRQWAVKFSETRKPCSCWMCGNPRRHLKGVDRLTIAERRIRCKMATLV